LWFGVPVGCDTTIDIPAAVPAKEDGKAGTASHEIGALVKEAGEPAGSKSGRFHASDLETGLGNRLVLTGRGSIEEGERGIEQGQDPTFFA
jgi:hypothetical protein